MAYRNFRKTIVFFLLPVCFLIAACDQSAVANTDLFYYHMSGGIAGFNQELKIDKDGVITGHDRMKEFSIESDADASSIIQALDKVDSAYFLAQKPEEPECCDQIYLIMQYKGLYIDSEALPNEVYQELVQAIDEFLRHNQK